jgi:hypothetical protein
MYPDLRSRPKRRLVCNGEIYNYNEIQSIENFTDKDIQSHNNVEIIIDSSENGYGKIGTYSNKGLDLVTGDQVRISITESGNITLGHEYKDSTITRVYGKMGVGVKNPTEQFEVAGNMKMGNRLFANGDTMPTTGQYQKGDIVWNSNPREDAFVGWICIAGGTPGTWRPFGKIM